MNEEIVFNQEKTKLPKISLKSPFFLGLSAAFLCVLAAFLAFSCLSSLFGPALTKEKFEQYCNKHSGEFSVEETKQTIYGDDLEGIYVCKNSKEKYKLTLTVFKKDFAEVSALDSTISSLKSKSSDSIKVLKNSKTRLKYSKSSAESSSASAGEYYKNTFLLASAETDKKAKSLLSKFGY